MATRQQRGATEWPPSADWVGSLSTRTIMRDRAGAAGVVTVVMAVAVAVVASTARGVGGKGGH